MQFKGLGEEGERVNLMDACHTSAFPPILNPSHRASQACPRSQVNRGVSPQPGEWAGIVCGFLVGWTSVLYLYFFFFSGFTYLNIYLECSFALESLF